MCIRDRAKTYGFSDKILAKIINEKDNLNLSQNDIFFARLKYDIKKEYCEVDTCAGEFKALTPYLYSTTSINPNLPNLATEKSNKKVLIIGGGPNRIGQGIEFDYCCVHASYALKDLGITTIMYNCNPETVSTDYDTSDILYFEPIDFEHLRAVIERENPDGVIVHFGGQTPLKYSKILTIMGAKIIGTSARIIDIAEDRKKFSEFANKIELKQPKNDTATSEDEALKKANEIGYPVLVRPSYVLGGRAMRKVENDSELKIYMNEAVSVSHHSPVLIDKFLKDAVELDVDTISDGKDVYVGAILEHIEEAGIHSGDSASILPPISLTQNMIDKVYMQTKIIALELGVIGLLNIQFAIFENELYIIEVNPRASRTVPFVSKATGIAMAKVATRVMWQGNLKEALKFYDTFNVLIEENGILKPKIKGRVCVKEAVFPFAKLPGADPILGPEMKSTGEVMGISDNFECSFIKSQIAANNILPKNGKIFISVCDEDKPKIKDLAQKFIDMGFSIVATYGTFKTLQNFGIQSELVFKISEGRPNIDDKMKNNEISFVINTSDNKSNSNDALIIRQRVLRSKIPYFTTLKIAQTAAQSIINLQNKTALEIKSLQEWLKV